jgi:mono/diheme cytochrome c family protein
LHNQVINPPAPTFWQKKVVKLLIVLIVLLAIILSLIAINLQKPSPYISSVLALRGDPLQGQGIFQINCAGCHTKRDDTQVGPSLVNVSQRMSDIAIIKQVTGGKTPPMPQFQPSSQEMADLLSYLKKY